MAIASITAWLSSKDKNYQQGRVLYEQYGSDPVVSTIIKTGSGSFHFSKLYEALEELNLNANLIPKKIEIPELPPISKDGGKWEGAPDPIIQIRNEKNLRYAQARSLFETMPAVENVEDRIEAAIRILDHMDFVSESWAAIDDWRKTGNIRKIEKEKELTEVSELNLKELIQQSKNIATYISKDRKKLCDETDPKRILKLKNRLELRTVKLNEIKRRLDELI